MQVSYPGSGAIVLTEESAATNVALCISAFKSVLFYMFLPTYGTSFHATLLFSPMQISFPGSVPRPLAHVLCAVLCDAHPPPQWPGRRVSALVHVQGCCQVTCSWLVCSPMGSLGVQTRARTSQGRFPHYQLLQAGGALGHSQSSLCHETGQSACLLHFNSCCQGLNSGPRSCQAGATPLS